MWGKFILVVDVVVVFFEYLKKGILEEGFFGVCGVGVGIYINEVELFEVGVF